MLFAIIATGASKAHAQTTHVYFLYDASKSYQGDEGANYRVIWNTLSGMLRYDKYSFSMIEDCSFQERSIFFRKNAEQKIFRSRLGETEWITKQTDDVRDAIEYLDGNRTDSTDLVGAISLAGAMLRQDDADNRVVVIFSDMEHDPAADCPSLLPDRRAAC